MCAKLKDGGTLSFGKSRGSELESNNDLGKLCIRKIVFGKHNKEF